MNVDLLFTKYIREELDAPCCPRSTVCYTCRHTIAVRLDWLAHNIAVGAMLCRAHALGDEMAQNIYWGSDHWSPGCGEPAPGVWT